MTIRDFKDMHEKEVILTTTEGETFRGKLYLGETEFDSMSGEDEIDIMQKDNDKCICFPVSDIKQVVIDSTGGI